MSNLYKTSGHGGDMHNSPCGVQAGHGRSNEEDQSVAKCVLFSKALL